MARDFKTGLPGLCVRPPDAIAKAGLDTGEFSNGVAKTITEEADGKLVRQCSLMSEHAVPTLEQVQARLEDETLNAEPAG